MRKCLLAMFVPGLLAAAFIGPQPSNQLQAETKKPPKKSAPLMKLKVGDMAPDFTLLQYDGQAVKPVSLNVVPEKFAGEIVTKPLSVGPLRWTM